MSTTLILSSHKALAVANTGGDDYDELVLRHSLSRKSRLIGVSPVDELVPLNLLSRGQCAQIEHLFGQVDQVHRLEELGLRAGVSIEMLQPGTPCIVRVADQKLCFRDAQLFNVMVRPEVAGCRE